LQGATLKQGVAVKGVDYFNPRSLAGSDLLIKVIFGGEKISIHAPLQGATRDKMDICTGSMISIHAPLQGAT